MRSGFIFSIMTGILFVFAAQAQVTPQEQERALRNLEQSQQRQENFLKNLENEQERRLREKKKPETNVPDAQQKIPLEEATGKKAPCFDIANIEFKGATIFNKDAQNKLITKYLSDNKLACLGMLEINNLMREVTNYYIEKGFVTTRTAIPQQDLKSGHVEIMVLEGVVEEIILNENTWKDKAQVAMYFPFMKGKILNLRDIEQGLDQLNRLTSSTATMQLMPGLKQNGTKVVITNKINKSTRASLGYDNTGQNASGKNKANTAFEQDNLLGLGEYWSFNYNKDTAAHGGEKGSEIYAGSVAVPFGYWTLSQNASHSKYNVTNKLTNGTLATSGETNSSQSKLDRVIYRSQNSKVSLNTSLKLKDIKSYSQNVLQTQSGTTYNLSIVTTGIDYTLRAWDAIWSASAGYEHGMDMFGATKDPENQGANRPSAQFNKYTFDASLYKPLTFAKQNLVWRSIISGQKTPDHLYSSERISLGDRYTVRGFDNNSAIGDSGGYVKNELAWNLPQFTQNPYVNAVAGNLQPYIGYDYGVTKLHLGKYSENAESGYLSGWATGIRNNSEYLNFDLAYSQAINAPAALQTKDSEVYFMVSLKYGF